MDEPNAKDFRYEWKLEVSIDSEAAAERWEANVTADLQVICEADETNAKFLAQGSESLPLI
jgi:hypothetical protein